MDKKNTQCGIPPNYYPKDNGCSGAQCAKVMEGGVVEAADPVDIGSGNKQEMVTDYTYNSAYSLKYTRYYNTKTKRWDFEYNRSLSYIITLLGEYLTLHHSDGNIIVLSKLVGASAWTNTYAADGYSVLSASNYSVVIKTNLNETETFTNFNTSTLDIDKSDFRLNSVKVVGGAVFNLSYDSTGFNVTVTDQYANKLLINRANNIFGCNDQPAVTSVVATNNNNVVKNYTYEYITNGGLFNCKLSKITKPDGKFTQYTYDGNENLANSINEMGVTDQKSVVDNNGATTNNSLGNGDVINRAQFNYEASRTVIYDGRNNYYIVNKEKVNGITRVTAFDKYCPLCIGIQGSAITYNANGYLDQVTDYRGFVTKYNFDSNNLLIGVTEAYGNALARNVVKTYNVATRDVAAVTEPASVGNNKVTQLGYDANQLVATLDISYSPNNGSTGSVTRSTDMYYNALGELIKIEGPQYIAGQNNDVVNIGYNAGRVATVTNGLGQTVSYGNYNDYGNPGTITGLNSDTYIIAYDTLGRMIGSTYQGTITTSYTYNDANQIIQITYPNLNYIKPYYDSGNRLIKIEQYTESNLYLGQIVYNMDNSSNITGIVVSNASGAVLRNNTAQYDAYNNLYRALDSLSQTTQYTYDGNNNATQIQDPSGVSINKTYDALNRLKTITNPDGGVATLNYNVDDTVASVIDPKNATTSYAYNGVGEIVQVNSPDTGTTNYTRDISGNVITKTDNKNNISLYGYDVLKRLTSITYPMSGQGQDNVSIVYDGCANGVGKVCGVNDVTGSTTYTYNNLGLLASKAYNNVNTGNPAWVNQGVNNLTLISTYIYNSHGQMIAQTYPSGLTINYSYTNNLVSALSYSYQGITTPLINTLTYEAFNSEFSSMVFANGNNLNQNFTQDGLISAISSTNIAPINKNYEYDSRFNLTNIYHNPYDSTLNATAGYDGMSRITHYNYGNTGNYNYYYSYDKSFDRLTRMVNSITTNYVYNAMNHQLTSTNGGESNYVTYDLNGNISSFSVGSLTYNIANRLVSSSFAGLSTQYLVNSQNQRINKTNVNENKYFVYSGFDLLGEYNGNSVVAGNPAPLSEIIYLNHRPIAVFRNGVIYYVYSDQLKTPRVIADNANNIVWTWENKEVFGVNSPTDFTNGLTTSAATLFGGKFNLRFMGQYFDIESGLNYNLNRDYNPNWGRYIQSDPIGLNGGINTYGYTEGNSLGGVDPEGLDIEYANHPVLFGANHSKLIITPNNQALYVNDERFKNIDANGKRFATIGAGHNITMHLEAKINRERDVLVPSNVRKKLKYSCSSEDRLIANLFQLMETYNDNKVRYTLIPQRYFDIPTGYNSNSFISGIGIAAGLSMPAANDTGARTPGYQNPVPLYRFK